MQIRVNVDILSHMKSFKSCLSSQAFCKMLNFLGFANTLPPSRYFKTNLRFPVHVFYTFVKFDVLIKNEYRGPGVLQWSHWPHLLIVKMLSLCKKWKWAQSPKSSHNRSCGNCTISSFVKPDWEKGVLQTGVRWFDIENFSIMWVWEGSRDSWSFITTI